MREQAEAVIRLLAEHPEGMKPHEIKERILPELTPRQARNAFQSLIFWLEAHMSEYRGVLWIETSEKAGPKSDSTIGWEWRDAA